MNMTARDEAARKRGVDAFGCERPSPSFRVPTLTKRRDLIVDATLELVDELTDDWALLGWERPHAPHDLGEATLAPEERDPGTLEVVLTPTTVERCRNLRSESVERCLHG